MPADGIKVINVDEDFKARVKVQASKERRSIKKVIESAYALYERSLKSGETAKIGTLSDGQVELSSDIHSTVALKYAVIVEAWLNRGSGPESEVLALALRLLDTLGTPRASGPAPIPITSAREDDIRSGEGEALADLNAGSAEKPSKKRKGTRGSDPKNP